MSEAFRGLTDKHLRKAHKEAQEKYIYYVGGGWPNLAANQQLVVNALHDEIEARKNAYYDENHDEWGNYTGPPVSVQWWKSKEFWLSWR